MSRFPGSASPSVEVMLEERVSQVQVVGRGASSSDERSCRSCCACRRCSRKIPVMGEQLLQQFATGQKLVLG